MYIKNVTQAMFHHSCPPVHQSCMWRSKNYIWFTGNKELNCSEQTHFMCALTQHSDKMKFRNKDFKIQGNHTLSGIHLNSMHTKSTACVEAFVEPAAKRIHRPLCEFVQQKPFILLNWDGNPNCGFLGQLDVMNIFSRNREIF